MSTTATAGLTLLFLGLLYLFLWTVAKAIGRHVSTVDRSPAAVTLYTIAPPQAFGASFTVDRPVVVGRSPDADIVLADPFASDLHGRFAVLEGRLTVSDLGSTNGTYVNEARVGGATPLTRGDTVRLGETIMEVR